MRKLSTILGFVLLLALVPGCPNPTPGQRKALDVLACFGNTLTSAAENFIAMLLKDAFQGATPDWKQAADDLIAKGEADALPDIGCALNKALNQVYSPPAGAAVNPTYVRGVVERVKYVQTKIVITVQAK